MLLLSSALLFLVSCGSYQNSSFYEDDINSNRQARVENNSNARVYKQYFRSISEENAEVLTDVDNYKSPNDSIVVVERRNNGGWGSNPTVVNVNVYDNSWGWNNWGWNMGFGWGGWYDPFWGPGWGMGWNNWGWGGGFGWGGGWGWNNWGWGGGWNNWCAPGWGFNNWQHGHALNTGRRPTSLIPEGGRGMNGRSLLSNDRSITGSRLSDSRTSSRFETDRTAGRVSRDSNGATTRPTGTRPTSSRESRYDDSRVSNQPTSRPTRTYTPSNEGGKSSVPSNQGGRTSAPSRSYEPSSAPSRSYSPPSSSPSRSSGGGSFGGSRGGGGSMGGGSRGGGRG